MLGFAIYTGALLSSCFYPWLGVIFRPLRVEGLKKEDVKHGLYGSLLGSLRLSIFAPSLYAMAGWACSEKFFETNIWFVKNYTPKAAMIVLVKDTLLFVLRRIIRKNSDKDKHHCQ